MGTLPRPDRVLQIHTRHRRGGSEDAVGETKRRLLEGAGIAVDQVLFDNADVQAREIVGRVGAAASPSVYRAAMRHRVPIVQTLHNYRFASCRYRLSRRSPVY